MGKLGGRGVAGSSFYWFWLNEPQQWLNTEDLGIIPCTVTFSPGPFQNPSVFKSAGTWHLVSALCLILLLRKHRFLVKLYDRATHLVSLGTKHLNEKEQHFARRDRGVPNKKILSQIWAFFLVAFFNANKMAVELMLPVGQAILKTAVKGFKESVKSGAE